MKKITHRLTLLTTTLTLTLILLTTLHTITQAATTHHRIENAPPSTTHHSSPTAEQTITGTLNGANYRIRIPDSWDGQTLVVYAHGYVAEGSELTAEAAPGGAAGEAAFLDEGYAIAGSSYSQNGWAVQQGITDTLALVNLFTQTLTNPQRTILLGASMGSVVAFESIEQYPNVYDGALVLCGLGAGASQNWDAGLAFALAYDVVFGWPESWGTIADVKDDIDLFNDVLPEVAPLPTTSNSQQNLAEYEFIRLVLGLPEEDYYGLTGWAFINLFYATQARAELERRAGGGFVQNSDHFYLLSAADRTYIESLGGDAAAWLWEMNGRTTITADPAARHYIESYADYDYTITRPVLTLHTRADGLVSTHNAAVYQERITAAGQDTLLFQMLTDSVGHCTFTEDQLRITLREMDNWLATGTKPTTAAFDPALGFLPETQPADWPIATKHPLWLPLAANQ